MPRAHSAQLRSPSRVAEEPEEEETEAASFTTGIANGYTPPVAPVAGE